MPVLQTIGTIAGYTVTTNRRSALPQDAVGGRTALTVALSNGTNTFETTTLEDDSEGGRYIRLVALGIINAFATIGASTALGAPGQSPAVVASSGGTTAYSKAVALTPGTPLPAGRGAIVKGSGSFVLKLQGGGTVTVYDPTGGSGTRHDTLAVIDADLTNAGTGATVQILY